MVWIKEIKYVKKQNLKKMLNPPLKGLQKTVSKKGRMYVYDFVVVYILKLYKLGQFKHIDHWAFR